MAQTNGNKGEQSNTEFDPDNPRANIVPDGVSIEELIQEWEELSEEEKEEIRAQGEAVW